LKALWCALQVCVVNRGQCDGVVQDGLLGPRGVGRTPDAPGAFPPHAPPIGWWGNTLTITHACTHARTHTFGKGLWFDPCYVITCQYLHFTPYSERLFFSSCFFLSHLEFINHFRLYKFKIYSNAFFCIKHFMVMFPLIELFIDFFSNGKKYNFILKYLHLHLVNCYNQLV